MIVNSTPSALTLRTNDEEYIVFPGEWTLEPKFYLSKKDIHRKGSQKPLTPGDRVKCLEMLMRDASARGWVVVVED